MDLKCSFCYRDQRSGKTLVRGLPDNETTLSAYICEDCLEQCYDRLLQERNKLAKGDDGASENQTTSNQPIT